MNTRRIALTIVVGICIIGTILLIQRYSQPTFVGVFHPPSSNAPTSTTATTQPALLPSLLPSPNLHGQVVIAAPLPLTAEDGALGQELQQAMTLASEEINHANGVNGKTLQIVFRDTRCQANADLLRRQVQDVFSSSTISAIMGGACSAEAANLFQFGQMYHVPVVSPLVDAPSLSSGNGYAYRLMPIATQAARAEAEASVNILHAKTAAVIVEQDSNPEALGAAFAQAFRVAGGRVTMNETYPLQGSDFRSIVAKVQTTHPDVIFIAPRMSAPGIVAIFDLRRAGVNVPILTTETLLNPSVIHDYADRLEGVYGVEPQVASSSAWEAFQQRYTVRFGTAPVWKNAAMNAYSEVFLMKDVLSAGAQSGAQVRQKIERLTPWSGGELQGLSFDAQRNRVLHAFNLFQLKEGQEVFATGVVNVQ